jgi:alpha-beta hydrolase superfamily lysophospholipase
VPISLAQADTLDALLKIAGGGAVSAILIALFWFLLSGKIVPGYLYEAKVKECDAQRTRAELAEGNLTKALAVIDRSTHTVDKAVDQAQPTMAGKGSQP